MGLASLDELVLVFAVPVRLLVELVVSEMTPDVDAEGGPAGESDDGALFKVMLVFICGFANEFQSLYDDD